FGDGRSTDPRYRNWFVCKALVFNKLSSGSVSFPSGVATKDDVSVIVAVNSNQGITYALKDYGIANHRLLDSVILAVLDDGGFERSRITIDNASYSAQGTERWNETDRTDMCEFAGKITVQAESALTRLQLAGSQAFGDVSNLPARLMSKWKGQS